MPIRADVVSLGHVVEVCWTQNATSGGSIDTATKLDAAIPIGLPSISAHSATTPRYGAARGVPSERERTLRAQEEEELRVVLAMSVADEKERVAPDGQEWKKWG